MLDAHISSQEQRLNSVAEAAHYEGHATAMIANLTVLGLAERAELWVPEQEVWSTRKSSLIAAGALKRESETVAHVAYTAGFEGTLCTDLTP